MARGPSRGSRPFTASTSSASAGSSSKGKHAAAAAAARLSKSDEAYTFIPSLPKHHRTSQQTLSLSREEAGPSKKRRTRRPLSSNQDGEDNEDENDDGSDDSEGGGGGGMAARVRKLAMMIAGDDLAELEEDSESSIDSDEAWEEEGSDEERWGDVFRDLDKGKAKNKKEAKGKEETVRKAAIPLNINLDESDDEIVLPTKGKDKGKGKAREMPNGKGAKAAQFGPTGNDSDAMEDELDPELDGELSPNEFEGVGGIAKHDFDSDDEGASAEEAGRGSDHSGNSDDDDDEEEEEESEEEEEEEEDDEDEDEDVELPSDLSDGDDMDDLDPSTLDGLDAFVDRLTASSKDKDGKATSSEPVAPEKKRRVLETIPGPALDGNELGLKSRQKLDLSTLIASHPSLSSASALLPTKTKPKDSYKTGSILKQGTLSAPLPTSVQDRLNREAAYEATKEEGAKWAGVMKRIKEAEHLSFPLQAEERGGVKSSGALLSEYKPRQGLESAVQSLLARANLTQDGITKRENEALESQELSVEEMEERRKRLREQRELIFRAETRAKRVARIKSKTFRKLARKRAAKAAGAEDLDETLESMDAEDRAEALEKAEMDRARERATLKHGARTSRWARQAGGSGMGMTGEEGRIAKEDMLEMKRKLSRRIQGRGDDSGGSDDSDEEGDEDNENEEEEEEGGEEAIKRRAFDQLAKVANGSNGDTAEASGLMGMAFMKKAEQRQKRKAAEEEESLKRDIEMFGDLDEVDSQGSNEEDDGTMMNVGGTGGRMVFSGPSRSSQSSGIQKPPLPQTSAVSGDTSKPKVRFESSWTANQEDEQLNPWLAQPTSSIGPSRKRQHGIGANSSAADKTVQSLKKAVKGSSTAEDDSRVEISLNPDAQPGQQDGDESGGDESDGDRMGTVPRKRVRLGQRDLVAEAFAGDNVVEDFAAEKARTIEEDAPKVEDTTLPGWGLWGGKGLKKRKSNPSRLVTKPGIDPLTRQDAKRDNVIISEKKDKKASKYLVKDLPYPYTSKAQYEKRFENPLGAEWNSRSGHQRETLPRVVRKPGAIIEPVRRLF